MKVSKNFHSYGLKQFGKLVLIAGLNETPFVILFLEYFVFFKKSVLFFLNFYESQLFLLTLKPNKPSSYSNWVWWAATGYCCWGCAAAHAMTSTEYR